MYYNCKLRGGQHVICTVYVHLCLLPYFFQTRGCLYDNTSLANYNENSSFFLFLSTTIGTYVHKPNNLLKMRSPNNTDIQLEFVVVSCLILIIVQHTVMAIYIPLTRPAGNGFSSILNAKQCQ